MGGLTNLKRRLRRDNGIIENAYERTELPLPIYSLLPICTAEYASRIWIPGSAFLARGEGANCLRREQQRPDESRSSEGAAFGGRREGRGCQRIEVALQRKSIQRMTIRRLLIVSKDSPTNLLPRT